LRVTVAGTTIDRQCASGLQAIAVAARSVLHDGVRVAVAGGVESISLVPLVAASELDTKLVMRALRNTGRVLKNAGVDRLLEIERERGDSLQISDIHDQVAGVYPKVMVATWTPAPGAAEWWSD